MTNFKAAIKFLSALVLEIATKRVADPGFTRRGTPAQTCKHQPIILANFPRKLYENEENWIRKARVSLASSRIRH